MTLRGTLPALDLDRWLPLLAEGGRPAPRARATISRSACWTRSASACAAVTMQGAADAAGWSATMNTAEFAGDLVYRCEGSGRLVARFTRFALPEDAPGVKPGEGMKDLPAVDIVADDFTHRGRKLGRVEVQARHEGPARLAHREAGDDQSGFGAVGQRRVEAGRRPRTSLAFKLEVSDVGLFLDRFGYPDHVKGGTAKVDGTLNWNGDPLTMDYATLSGKLQLHAEDGRFLEIEPGVGKLVSLVSLQMLPRRVTLDFRDVFSKGFQWDRIDGTMGIERGVWRSRTSRCTGRPPTCRCRAAGPVAGDAGPDGQGGPAAG